MNDIMTLTDIRDKIFKEYNLANADGDSYMEANGLLAALYLVENALEEEIYRRDKYPVEAR